MIATFIAGVVLQSVAWNPYWISQAYDRLPQYKRERDDLHWLIMREGGGNPSRHAQNPRSTAYGLGQFLDATWAGTNIAKTSDGIKQISAMIIYCHNRYGSVAKAKAFWKARRWY